MASERERDKRKITTILAAETLKVFTVLNQQCPRRANKEAHPKAVLSTKKKLEDSPADPRGCSSPCDGTTPVNSTARTLTIVPSPRCLVSRQRSTPVDLPPAATLDSLAQQVVAERSSNRPATLGFNRGHSNSSESSGATLCPMPPSPGAGRQLGSSYPPGPARLQQCYEASQGDGFQLHCDGALSGTSHQVLARRIAQRLIAIGDDVTNDADSFTVEEILETFVTSYKHDQGVGLTWGSIGRLYRALSRLLTQSVYSRMELEANEAWQTFSKLWKTVLQSVSTWIADNGGWFALIRATDDTNSSCFMSSTPDCSRRRFTYSHPPFCSGDAPRYSTPQVPRRSLCQNQSSPAICLGSDRGEGVSRVLSLTQEGMFHLEGMCENSPASSEEEEQRSPDEGIQFAIGSQSSFSSEGCSSPTKATPPNSRPQSSTTLREATPISEEAVVFDRNRSMSYPRRRRRPSSAGTDAQRRLVHSVMEDREMLCESLDSGLAASSETSIASTDSGLLYSTLGVSAVCVFEAVKSMLDHK